MKVTVIHHPLSVKLDLQNGEFPTLTPCENEDQAYSYARGLIDGAKASHRLSAGPLGYQIQQFESAFLERLALKSFALNKVEGGGENLTRELPNGNAIRISDRTGLKLPTEDDWAVSACLAADLEEPEYDCQCDDDDMPGGRPDFWTAVKDAMQVVGAA